MGGYGQWLLEVEHPLFTGIDSGVNNSLIILLSSLFYIPAALRCFLSLSSTCIVESIPRESGMLHAILFSSLYTEFLKGL